MPLDFQGFPNAAPPTASAAEARQRVAAARWLLAVAGMVLIMVCLGGATRLTGSGLSIMEWRPLTGWLPPLSEAEWQRLFDLYRTIPQYLQVNRGMSLAEFKGIFWLEYIHRLWGKLIGLAFLLPFLYFLVRGWIARAMVPRLAMLFALGGLQGFIGWFMVASGFFEHRTEVSPYRLVIHLGMAFVIYAALLWTALDLMHPRQRDAAASAASEATGRLRPWLRAASVLLVLAMLAGGFVAGTRAGFTYNTFPLMDGALVPEGYWSVDPWWLAPFEDIPTVQFNHRLLATLALLASLGAALVARRPQMPPAMRGPCLWLALTAAAQYLLGVVTLLLVVPVPIGTLHQGFAVIVLTVLVWCWHVLGRDRPA
ncbi:MAG: COX15/CtaA family protein [Alphaproteobacteria bacterium]|nr:COX15/CtaA family protein [Alphaproteobacteria bacterium]